MSRQQLFNNGVIVSSKFLNDQQQGLTGAMFGGALTAHSSDVTKVSLVPVGHEVVAPLIIPSGTGLTTEDHVVGYRTNSVHSTVASGASGARNIWAVTTSAAQGITPGTYEVSVLPTADTPAETFRRKIGTANWTGSALNQGRLVNGVQASAAQTNMFTFKSMFDTTSDIPLTIQGGVSQQSGNGVLLSVGGTETGSYAQKWSLTAKGRLSSYQAVATDDHYRAFVTGDANPVLSLSSMLKMGPGGATAVDTTLERASAGVVKVTNTVDVVSIQNSTGSGAVAGAVNILDGLNITGGLTFTGTALAAAHLSDSSALARLASPAFTGVPTTPTAAPGTNTTQLASTAFVSTAVASINSVVLTGVPTAPTAAVDTNTTQLATTAYVVGQGYLKTSTAATTYAPLASPSLTGTPTAPTAAPGTNTTQLASTAFVTDGIGTAVSTLTGTIASTYAPLASPALTGTPTAPTQTAGNSSTSLATTAFVTGGIGTAASAANTYAATLPVSVVVSASTSLTLSSPATVLTSALNVAVTLPAAGTWGAKACYLKVGNLAESSSVTITPSSGTIDGAANFVIDNPLAAIVMLNDGTNWFVF